MAVAVLRRVRGGICEERERVRGEERVLEEPVRSLFGDLVGLEEGNFCLDSKTSS